MHFANIITFLHFKNEPNILRKVLLDICFKEVNNVSYFLLERDDPTIKKIREKIVGQSPKNPKDGPHFDSGEEAKFKLLSQEFIDDKTDLKFTNYALQKLEETKVIDALKVVKANYKRVGGFDMKILTTKNFRRVSKDALRVGILAQCSLINKAIMEE